MDAVLRTDLPDKDIIAMSRAERAAARERAKPEQARKAAERAECVRLWRAWSDGDPDRFGVLDWKKYLDSIGRLDLWRDLSAPEPDLVARNRERRCKASEQERLINEFLEAK